MLLRNTLWIFPLYKLDISFRLNAACFCSLAFFSLLSLAFSSFFYFARIFRLNIHEWKNGDSSAETNLFRKFHSVEL